MAESLAGRVALVTGTAQGIGSAIAAALRDAGAVVTGVDREDCDVSDSAAVAELVAGLGRVDVLVNCAGGVVGQVGRPLEGVSDEDWRAVVDANLTSTFVCTRAVTPGMKAAGWGRIVNISSGAGRSVSLTGIQAYASAKAGQLGFTRQTAHELGPFGITVNAIAPGFVLSNPTSAAQWESYGDEGQLAILERIALRRLGSARDIAEGVVFLASAAWITGQVLSIDGGSALFEQLAELAAFLAIPSVSLEGGPPMRAAADWVAARVPNGRVVEGDHHPVVLGELAGPSGSPTILVYGHYDVQPPGDLSEWETPPFEPSVRDGRIYARGASDDKGPVFVALETARGGAPLNVKFLFEGEEEIGSPNLANFLETHADELLADFVVSADGAMWRPSEPSVPVAAKGLLALDIEVTGPASDLHSGRHGGAVQNPNHALARIVAGLHDDDGRVAVPGFYDGVTPRELGDIPFDEATYQAEVGVPALHGEPGFSTLERLWTRPTLEVNGLAGGGAFTVIPRRASAHITCRLVPGQDPDAVFAAIERHITAPPGVQVTVTAQPGAVRAYELDHPAVDAAVAALRHAYPGSEPLLVRIGGTLPAAVIFERVLGLKTLLFSFSTADERLHAPNEFFRLERIDAGIVAWTELWRRLSAMMRA